MDFSNLTVAGIGVGAFLCMLVTVTIISYHAGKSGKPVNRTDLTILSFFTLVTLVTGRVLDKLDFTLVVVILGGVIVGQISHMIGYSRQK